MKNPYEGKPIIIPFIILILSFFLIQKSQDPMGWILATVFATKPLWEPILDEFNRRMEDGIRKLKQRPTNGRTTQKNLNNQ